jgi:uncharacterized protein (TIGR00255 family)
MALQSMTGFARVEGTDGTARWQWELRSVNGRGLDTRMRLPPGLEHLEPQVRQAIAAHVVRGSINATLTIDRQQADMVVRLNERVLRQVLAAADQLTTLAGTERPSADALLAIRGVLEVVEVAESPGEIEQRTALMLASLDQALCALVEARRDEGRRLASVIRDQLDQITGMVAQIAALPTRRPEVVAAKLAEAIKRVVDNAQGLDPARVHQEAVLVATRIDVEEELKRLAAHVAAARDLLSTKEPVGRKLDFLAQEFNREANTLCSKSNDAEMTRLGLALKVVIDQMREQVQNIE